MASPVTKADADKALQDQERFRDELAELRPRTNWLHRRIEQILEENHLAEKVRHALENQ